MNKFSAAIKAVALATMLAGWSVHAPAQTTIELNFNDARIDAVASAVGAMVGKNVIVDPKVKGNLTLISEKPVTPQQALAQLQGALRLHGFAMIDSGSMFKVVPEAEAKSHATKVNAPAVGGEVQTRVFHLNHETAANMLNVVKPLVSANNVVNVNPGTNSLVVTDYADNIARIARLIASLDRSNSADLEIIPLEHAIATEMVPLLQRLMDGAVPSGGTGGSGAGSNREAALGAGGLNSGILADSRSNSLIVRAANPAKLAQIRSLVARLDQPALQNDVSAGNIHVVHLKHADAISLAETLRAAIRTIEQSAPVTQQGNALQQANMGNTGANGNLQTSTNNQQVFNSSQGGGGLNNTTPLTLGQTLMPSVGGQVQADPNTNTLIITAPAPLYRQLRAVIDKLDSRRAQVLVESMIVEVSDDRLAEFGVQWQAAIGGRNGTMGAIGTNYNRAGANLLSLTGAILSGDPATQAQALGSLGGGMNLALIPKALGQHYLGALANFLQSDGRSNILSKPNLMTLDNQEARIIIGKNVPFVTGSYATTGSSSTVNPFTTVERKDVGLMLRVKPTINENGTVKLTVNQEVSDVVGTSTSDPNGLTTNKRAIESTVLVENGSIVMLGGLLQEGYTSSMEKVPLLGDIPVVGNLFRSENRSGQKNNLMIFLRPIVMRDAQDVESFAFNRYQEIRALQETVQPPPSFTLGNVKEAPVAPALTSTTGMPAVQTQPVPASLVEPDLRIYPN